jgi:cobaltochelatase CobT
VVLPFGMKASRNASRFALSARGGTPMTDGLIAAARSLVTRPEPRKLLLTVTDGQPDNQASARILVRHLAQRGVELYGLGLGTNSVRHLFPQSDVIHNVASLAPTLLGMLRRTLTFADAA